MLYPSPVLSSPVATASQWYITQQSSLPKQRTDEGEDTEDNITIPDEDPNYQPPSWESVLERLLPNAAHEDALLKKLYTQIIKNKNREF